MKDYHYTAKQFHNGNFKAEISDTEKNQNALFESLRWFMKEGYTKIEIEVRDRE